MVENMRTKFLVSVPEDWIKLKNYIINLNDVGEFYHNLFKVLDTMCVDVETTTVIKKLIKTDGIFLSHHTNLKNRNVWNIKKGYLNNHLYFDKTGYSGWADMANNEALFNKTQAINFYEVEEWFDAYAANYIKTRSSKVRQSEEGFSLDEPYVFVAGQRPHDTVSDWAYIPTIQLMKDVIEQYRDSKYKVVIKVHPLEKAHKQAHHYVRDYDFLQPCPDNVIVTEASIHDIIPNAGAVYTVNSGVGFESLLYLKRVFVSGHCDYRWAATTVRTIDEIRNTMHLLDEPVDKELIVKFMHYMLTEYFVNTTDLVSIRNKLEQAIKEYNEI